MDYEELLEYLDIDSAEDFAFFENFADLMECEEEIPVSCIYKLLGGADMQSFSEAAHNYFEELLNGLPEEDADIYILLESIKCAICGLAGNLELENNRTLLAEELDKFRKWYLDDSRVACTHMNSGRVKTVPLSEAIVLARLEKLNEAAYQYDFSEALHYDLDEYLVSLGKVDVSMDDL